MHGLGVAATPLPRSTLTADTLAAALRVVMTDDGMRATASVMGSKIRAERGVERAVEAMAAFLSGETRA